MKPKTQYIIAMLLTVKIAVCLFFVFQIEMGSLFGGTAAIASENAKSAEDKTTDQTASDDPARVDINFIAQNMALTVVAPRGVIAALPEPTHHYGGQNQSNGFILENGAERPAHGSVEKGSLVDLYI